MPLAYSEDLRWRVVWLYLYMDVAADDISRLLHISERSVYRYVQRFKSTGEVRKCHKTNGPACILSEHEELIIVNSMLSSPGIYLRELQQHLSHSTGRWIHESTICRCLKRLGMSRQKIQHIALQRCDSKRAEFIANVMMVFESSLCVWVDETGCDRRNAQRKYGYGIRGQTPQDFSLKLRGKRYSAISILSTEGVEDTYITEGTVNGDIFLDFVRKQLVPILSPFDGHTPRSVVILDNAAIHHVDRVVTTILSTGALLKFLPPYSPDMNPIELIFGEMKQYLQANNILFETSLSVQSILYMAFNSISQENCNAYIAYSGYT